MTNPQFLALFFMLGAILLHQEASRNSDKWRELFSGASLIGFLAALICAAWSLA